MTMKMNLVNKRVLRARDMFRYPTLNSKESDDVFLNAFINPNPDFNKYQKYVDVVEVQPDSEPFGKVYELTSEGFEVINTWKGCIQLAKPKDEDNEK